MNQPSDFGRVAETYDDARGGIERGRVIAADINTRIEPHSTLLEIGIGTGVVGASLQELGHDVWGTDISPEMLAKSAERIDSEKLRVADAVDLPFDSESFPYICMAWFLHVVIDPEKVLRETARVLQKDGKCFVICGGESFPDEIIAHREKLRAALSPTQAKRLHGDFVQEIAQAAGFTVTEVTFTTPRHFREAPIDEVRRIEARQYSWLLDVSDSDWKSIVQPVIDELMALPHPEQPIDRISQFDFLNLERS